MNGTRNINTSVIVILLLCFVIGTHAADTTEDFTATKSRVDSIKRINSSLPNVPQQKWNIWEIVSKMFNTNGRIWNLYIKAFSNITWNSNNNIPLWNGTRFAASSITNISGRIGIWVPVPTQVLDIAWNAKATSFIWPLTWNASTASTLQTARTINGVSFNGWANITLPTVNTSGNQTISWTKTFSSTIAWNITWNAATTTKLSTPRNLSFTWVVSGSALFDGSSDISLTSSLADNSIDGTKLVNNSVSETQINDNFVARNSTLLNGNSSSESNVWGSVAVRNINWDINARLFRSEYDTTNATIWFIMTQIDTASNNYFRPSTPAQFRAWVTDGAYIGINTSWDQILDGTIDGTEIEDNSITWADIAANSINGSELAANSVSSSHIMDGQVTGADIASNTISETQISDSFVARDSQQLDGISGNQYTRSDVYTWTDFNALTDSSRVTSINANTNTPFWSAWYNVYNSRHRGGITDGNAFWSQIAIWMTNFQNRIAFRNQSSWTWGSWYEIFKYWDSWDNIQDGTIDWSEIQDNSITTTDILNNTVDENDISDSFIARDSQLLNWVASSSNNVWNTVAVRNVNWDISSRLFRSEFADQTWVSQSSSIAFRNNDSSDNFIRFVDRNGLLAYIWKSNDSDLLDGINSTQFIRSDSDDSFNGRLSPVSTNSRRAWIYWIYDSTRIGHVWSMWTQYAIDDNGATYWSLYGLAYKHTNNTTWGTMAWGHQISWVENWVPKVSLWDNVWTSGSFIWNGASITNISGDNIQDGTIDGSEIQDNTLTAADIASNSITWNELSNTSAFTMWAITTNGKLFLNQGTAYDLWIEWNGTTGTSPRNLAFLWVKSTDQLRVNFWWEYSWGTLIQGNVWIWVSPTQALDVAGNIDASWNITAWAGMFVWWSAIIMSGVNNVWTAPDIQFKSAWGMAAEWGMYINIDSDNNEADQDFSIWNGTNTVSTWKLFIVTESGYNGFWTDTPTYRIQLPNVTNNKWRWQANSWVTYSDGRFKTDKKIIDNALSKVQKINGITYRSIEWENAINNDRQVWFIAQEVYKVLPEAVSISETTVLVDWETKVIPDYQSISYDKITALLVQAMKEQQLQIEELQNQILTLSQK